MITFELHYALFSAVWSVAHTTLAVPWHVVPGTVCPLTPPRCTPSPRPAAQAQGRGQSPGRGPVQRPADRHVHSSAPNFKWAWRRPMMMMPKALRDLPTFQSVGECVCVRKNRIENTRETMHENITKYNLKPQKQRKVWSRIWVHLDPPSFSPPGVHKLALIEADSHKINKLNEAADIIHLAHVTSGYWSFQWSRVPMDWQTEAGLNFY